METDANVEIGGYVLRFSVVYFWTVIAVAVISTLLKIDSSSGSVIPTIAATMAASIKFINENKRVPNAYEKKQLIGYSLVATLAMSLGLVVVFMLVTGSLGVFLEALSVAGFGILIVALLIGFGLEALLLYFGYGWLANKQYAGLVKQGKI